MKRIVTICAACKKELAPAGGPFGQETPPLQYPSHETLYSHGICLECGLKWYGAEVMRSTGAGIVLSEEPEGCLQNPI
jgi:hypothetical protein